MVTTKDVPKAEQDTSTGDVCSDVLLSNLLGRTMNVSFTDVSEEIHSFTCFSSATYLTWTDPSSELQLWLLTF
jgi:hypothetical protein